MRTPGVCKVCINDTAAILILEKILLVCFSRKYTYLDSMKWLGPQIYIVFALGVFILLRIIRAVYFQHLLLSTERSTYSNFKGSILFYSCCSLLEYANTIEWRKVLNWIQKNEIILKLFIKTLCTSLFLNDVLNEHEIKHDNIAYKIKKKTSTHEGCVA